MKQTLEEAAKMKALEICPIEGESTRIFIMGAQFGAEWQAKKSPWISVKGKLPMDYEPKLIMLKDGTVRLACWDIDDDSNTYYWNDTYAYETFRAWDITHWMPIPSLMKYSKRTRVAGTD